ncbi:TPM domain-containing protein [Phenylobacterium montanum]|uniref:TPM domain-containing protein n=1 Tax=Phenylobacterium montanum TaxID=2823693 RepID=A0A975G462_9CAUL|nr:TPM domain-containing protein [Caulobacter sp. S6]
MAAVFALVLALAGGQGAFADPKFPTLTGRVVDEAHVLSPDTQAKLTSELAALEAKNGDQLVVVTLPDLQGYPIEDFGYQLLRTWGIGQKGKDNGAIFIVVPSEHKVRIEVGYGLEPVLTDGLSSIILQRSVLPRFRSGDIEGGVVAGTESLVQQLGLSPEEAQARAQEAQQAVVERPARRHGSPLQGLIVIIFVVLFISSMLRGRGGGWWFLPFLFMGGGGRYRGDDGFGGGGFGGGGGFSGGGGSGGGGGASGSW